MVKTRKRKLIEGETLEEVDGIAPLQGVTALAGVRIYDVGQGDSIAVLDDQEYVVLTIDYGGRQGNPFKNPPNADVDVHLPVDADRFVMLSHWDEDHWCTASRGKAVQDARWLVPRQVTSPRAVRFSRSLKDKVRCIPEARVQEPFSFQTDDGDEVWWEKIDASATSADKYEDCNKTGVAYSIVKRRGKTVPEVILVPGDAPFHRVGHYARHLQNGYILRGLVAFHHGAETHWTDATRKMLNEWHRPTGKVTVVYSFAKGNCYGHPFPDNYRAEFADDIDEKYTADLRESGDTFFDIKF